MKKIIRKALFVGISACVVSVTAFSTSGSVVEAATLAELNVDTSDLLAAMAEYETIVASKDLYTPESYKKYVDGISDMGLYTGAQKFLERTDHKDFQEAEVDTLWYTHWFVNQFKSVLVPINTAPTPKPEPIPEPTPITPSTILYRAYNKNSGEHFFTSSKAELDNIVKKGWLQESNGWNAATSGIPVYRLYNPNSGEHLFTITGAERDMLVKVGWKLENNGQPVFYSDSNKGVPVYRLFNPNTKGAGSHHYTTNEAEYNQLGKLGWIKEGVHLYGVK